ncbi:MAG: hypothetical protein AAGD07_24720 [Planctomycetota bacterium]
MTAFPPMEPLDHSQEQIKEVADAVRAHGKAKRGVKLPAAFDNAVARFHSQRNRLIDLGVNAAQIGMALDDGFASTDGDYPTLFPTRQQLADYPHPMLIDANPRQIRLDNMGHDEQTREARIALATSLTTIAFIYGIDRVRTENPKDLFLANRMIDMLARSSEPGRKT